MAANSYAFNVACKRILEGLLTVKTDTLKVMLCMSSCSAIARATDAWRDELTIDAGGDFTSDELDTATGYTAGGETVTLKTPTQDDASNQGEIRATGDSVTWTGVSQTTTRQVVGALFYESSTAKVPVAFYSFTSAFNTNGGEVKVNFSSGGILQMAAG